MEGERRCSEKANRVGLEIRVNSHATVFASKTPPAVSARVTAKCKLYHCCCRNFHRRQFRREARCVYQQQSVDARSSSLRRVSNRVSQRL